MDNKHSTEPQGNYTEIFIGENNMPKTQVALNLTAAAELNMILQSQRAQAITQNMCFKQTYSHRILTLRDDSIVFGTQVSCII